MYKNTKNNNYLFTSESVTEGHPDKICDQIADAILDKIIRKEIDLQNRDYSDESGAANVSNIRCAVECLVTKCQLVLAGEVRTQCFVDAESIARDVVRNIGYTNKDYGFDADACGFLNNIHGQSQDIARGVDNSYENKIKCSDSFQSIGAGDQGIIFGYACDDTEVLMPMPIFLAHKLSERLTYVRKSGVLDYLLPDGKTQVTLRYVDGIPYEVDTIVLSTQHKSSIQSDNLKKDINKFVIKPVLEKFEINISKNCDVYINPTGRFVCGGPAADTGVTGRKLIVDSYGGAGHHGGGAFSGKDPTKVDRSASYMARYVAKNIVAAKLADKCEIQIAYAIGVANPVSIYVDTFNTNKVSKNLITQAVEQIFDLRPGAILHNLKLWRPIYQMTSNYGHFGRERDEFYWEKTDKVNDLIKFCTH